MSLRKKGLGKGLSALVQESIDNPFVEIAPDLEGEFTGDSGILTVGIESILPGRYQPRKEFNESFLKELADSIKHYGVIQPLVVSYLGNNTYELVAGERRLRASKMAGLQKVPIVIREFDEKDRLAVALIENIQRSDLNALEVAEAYQELIDRLGFTQEQVSNTVGKSRTAVTNTLRLLKLPQNIRIKIINEKISEGHGRAILSLYPNFQKMEELAEIVETENLSVRQTEEFVRKMSNNTHVESLQLNNQKQESKVEERLMALEEKLIQLLGVKTKISGSVHKGSIKLFYYNKEELEVLIRNIVQRRS